MKKKYRLTKWDVGVSSRSEGEEKSRNTHWAIWLPILAATIGAVIWFFLFIIMDLGG